VSWWLLRKHLIVADRQVLLAAGGKQSLVERLTLAAKIATEILIFIFAAIICDSPKSPATSFPYRLRDTLSAILISWRSRETTRWRRAIWRRVGGMAGDKIQSSDDAWRPKFASLSRCRPRQADLFGTI
jgi:hypothetical protein